MTVKALFLITLLLSTPALAADPDATARGLAEAALAGDAKAYEYLEDLTTSVGQRLAGTEAEKRGADWGEAQMRALGLANVRQERFPLQVWERGREDAMVLSPAPQRIAVTALGWSPATPVGGIEAEVALVDSLEALKAAPANAYKGKIVLVTQATPRTHDGSGYGATGPIRRFGALEAKKRGAVAFLLRSLGTHHHRFAHAGSQDRATITQGIPAAAVSPPDVELLQRLAKRGPLRMTLTLTPKPVRDGFSQNVIGEITGSEKPEEIVLVGAHIDSWDLGTGAIDDGAGTAIVLGAARLIKALPSPPKRTIRFVLFGAEEQGITGGRSYAEKHKADNHLVVTEADFGQGPVYGLNTRFADPEHPTAQALMRVLAPLGVVRGSNAADGGPDVSPMVEAGVPAIDLAMEGTDYFDLHHTADDTFDKIERGRINQSVAAYVAALWTFSELGGDFRVTKP